MIPLDTTQQPWGLILDINEASPAQPTIPFIVHPRHSPNPTHPGEEETTMTKYWGLSGSKLSLAIWVEACFGVMIFGYNQSSAGGVLGDDTFNAQFPRMDTVNTSGATKEQNARIQGSLSSPTSVGQKGLLGRSC